MLNIYFKLVYSFGIYINIPQHLKISQLNSFIKDSVYNAYGINNFCIAEGGTKLNEKNNPIDENQDILFHEKYTDKNVFYIKPKIYCSICMQDNYEYRNLSCHHIFCNICINQWVNLGNSDCPICRAIIR